ncbi:unnamed protein product [Mesocestoides corti]|uniref:F-box domain-containing protein n=1 Tax=Mesocestoides corti TaxID=53468 RepID=A0A0R3UII1_MESCO|nr:unnamed protein product [Mesocestoides corti]
MPFLSPDWRCPGEKWIRSSDGVTTWENAKHWRERVFANMNAAALRRIYRQSLTDDRFTTEDFESILANIVCFQPHIRLNLNSTREIANVSTITDALLKLDMKSAIKDIRRFNYVCKLVRRLLDERLHSLGGRSQLYIIELLKVIMHQVLGSSNQTLIFRQLLATLRANLQRHEYDHIGSSQLWACHWDSLNKMESALNNFDINQSSGSTSVASLESLPFECLKRIIANINSPDDLESASIASPTLALIINDELLWKSLTIRNFTPNQIMSVQCGRSSWKPTLDVFESGVRECNWRRAYIRLLRRYGEQQIYSACLGICENCSCLFWMLLGHPCYHQEKPPRIRVLSPEDFIRLFVK